MEWDKGGWARVGQGSTQRGKGQCAKYDRVLGLMAIFSGRLFGLLYWWIGTTWYRLTTAASLLDVFVLTR